MFTSDEGDELVADYAQAAAAHARATAAGDSSGANLAYDRIARIYRTLCEEGHRERLLPLLTHADTGVRTWAAAHALEFAPADGEPVLKEIAEGEQGLDGFNAEQTLRTWRDGTLSFP